MDNTTIITLLTVAVSLLSLVIVTLLILAIVLLVKLKKIADNMNRITNNVASATDWLVPSKLIGEVSKLFRRK